MKILTRLLPGLSLGRFMILMASILALFTPMLLKADGLIIIHDPPHHVPGHFTFAPLEVSYHRVDVQIKDLVAVTSIDQEFYNPNKSRLEGTYLFPLPEGAHIDKFAMDIDGKMMEAELLAADKAKALYEEIVRKQRDPALLEYAGRGAFKVRIFPIEPNSRKRIKIAYTQLLKSDGGLTEYVYPLNTEKFSSVPVKDVSVRLSIDGKEPLKNVYCPSHKTDLRREGEFKAVLGYEDRNVRPDTDFKVIFSRRNNPLGINLLTSRRSGEDGYFMLLASPGFVSPKGTEARKDICFVLDSSGSMAGDKLEQAKKSLRFCLANLNPGDRFEIIRFSTEAEALFKGLQTADKEHIAAANSFVDQIKPIGGTAIGEALAMALANKKDAVSDERPYVVIFLTDGLPTIGETREDPIIEQLKKASQGTRIFPFGIGSDVNTHLLDRIASETRAASQYVLQKEDLEVKLSNFYTKIKEPVFCKLNLEFSNPSIRVTKLYPNPLPDLFNGDMLVLFGRYSGSGDAEARISGVFSGENRQFCGKLDFPESNPENSFIPQLWATRRVGWLLDEIRMHGESAEVKDEVTKLAREFGIVTPYTAYLILEDERRRDVPLAFRNFQEMERDGRVVAQSKARMESVYKESAAPEARSGDIAVTNAMSMQGLKDNSSFAADKSAVQYELKKSGAPLEDMKGYRASQTRNYAQQARVLNGRAFYQNGNIWVDSTAQSQKNIKQQKIVFNSDEYFELIRKNPSASPWFSLGNELDLIIGDTLYQIRES
ncbi:MAG: hypothetical protein A2X49_06525 [Lentisphaerae bacterium GWF2_52_8]|nr:MAG: hypothetical protein A2X49_06525 [Lentisphaerae bacterium GWF2_52_8]